MLEFSLTFITIMSKQNNVWAWRTLEEGGRVWRGIQQVRLSNIAWRPWRGGPIETLLYGREEGVGVAERWMLKGGTG